MTTGNPLLDLGLCVAFALTGQWIIFAGVRSLHQATFRYALALAALVVFALVTHDGLSLLAVVLGVGLSGLAFLR